MKGRYKMSYYDPYDRPEPKSSLVGHAAYGGGATITDSPINFNISINITEGTRLEDENGRPTEAGKTLGFLAKILSGFPIRGIEDGRLHSSARSADQGAVELSAEILERLSRHGDHK